MIVAGFACTQAQRDALQEAIATGAQSFTHSGGGGAKSVTLRTQDEMIALLAKMDAYLSPTSAPRKFQRVGF
mgnify:CR=1 FL=1